MSGVLCAGCHTPTGDSAFLCPLCQEAMERQLLDMAGANRDQHGRLEQGLFWHLEVTAAKLRGVTSGNASGGDKALMALPYSADRQGSPKASRIEAELITCLVRTAKEYGADGLQDRLDGLLAEFDDDDEASPRQQAIRREISRIDREEALLAIGPSGVAAWILGQMHVIRLSPTAGETKRDLGRHYGQALACMDRRPEQIYICDCPTPYDIGTGVIEPCGVALRTQHGETEVACWRCRTVHDVDALLAARAERLDQQLATVREIAEAEFMTSDGRRITSRMIDGYVRRKTITAHGKDRHKAALYLVREVRMAAERAATRAA